VTDLEPQHGLAAQIATGIGQLLAQAATAAGDRGAADAEEITAITDAMIRLLAGLPLRSDGKLTIKSLAAEAGLLRNKLTHKHTGLKDLFNALVKAQHTRPAFAEDLHRENMALREKLAKITQERDDLKASNEQFARVVHVLEVETQQLRAAAAEPDNVRPLHSPTT
jgi:chromosome segregation ATPase